MFPVRNNIRKVLVLRPGALGDVLAARGVIRFVKDAFPGAEVNLIAPGERGAFLCRPGWADRWFDWERAAFAWLFSAGDNPPPPALRAVFAGCDWLLAYLEPGEENGWARFEERVRALAPAAALVLCPSRPEAGLGEPIGEWLIRPAWAFCRRFHVLPPETEVDLSALAAARIRVEGDAGPAYPAGRYAVLHPGSGSGKKNWPLANFAALGRLALAEKGEGGEPLFLRLVVTSGEADGDSGARLAAMLPGAGHMHQAALERLGGVLANAGLFVGNDSGVSHLAAAVMNDGGSRPRQAVLFGPSDAAVWAPPGALVLEAGEGMDQLPAAAAWQAIRAQCLAGRSCGAAEPGGAAGNNSRPNRENP